MISTERRTYYEERIAELNLQRELLEYQIDTLPQNYFGEGPTQITLVEEFLHCKNTINFYKRKLKKEIADDTLELLIYQKETIKDYGIDDGSNSDYFELQLEVDPEYEEYLSSYL